MNIAVISADHFSGGNIFQTVQPYFQNVLKQTVLNRAFRSSLQPSGEAFKQAVLKHHGNNRGCKEEKGSSGICPVPGKHRINEPLYSIDLKETECDGNEREQDEKQKMKPVLL